MLFTLYSVPIEIITRMRGLSVHLRNRDSELYLAFRSAKAEVSIVRGERCVNDISTWMTFHKLKVNDDKTDILEIQSKWDTSRGRITPIRIGEESIPLSEVRCMHQLGRAAGQALQPARSCSPRLQVSILAAQATQRCQNFLSQRTAETLIHAFIMSKLDYCNALLYGLPDRTIALLQHVQNEAAREVTRSRKSDHITPILRDFHLLRIRESIAYSIMTYRAHNGSGPRYLAELIQPHRHGREFRSASANKFHYHASILPLLTPNVSRCRTNPVE